MSAIERIQAMIVVAVALGALSVGARAIERHVPDPYLKIQDAIDDCVDGDVVVVADSVDPYTGDRNKDLDFGGRAITVRSAGGNPSNCRIDCEGFGRGFRFHNNETPLSVVRGFTIKNGSSSNNGGAILCEHSGPKIINCVLQDNTASPPWHQTGGGGGIACLDNSAPVISVCTLQGNTTIAYWEDASGGAIFCASGSSPLIVDCLITGNQAASFGGAIYCNNARPIISRCVVTGNHALQAHGQAIYCAAASPTITNCLVYGNDDDLPNGLYGGGVACVGVSKARITNCTIADNVGGSGIYCEGDAQPVIRNCILWNNSPDQIVQGNVAPEVTYSDVQGGWAGDGNIDAYPQFRAAGLLAPWDTPYFLSQPGPQDPPWSPCVNVQPGGDTAAEVGLANFTTRTDLVAEQGRVDMGYHYATDCNGNEVADPWDIALGTSDCNQNGVLDWCDINVFHTSVDSNADGIPDECQGPPAPAVFTDDAQFEEGTLINVHHDEPYQNQLQRCEKATPLPYLWVPISNKETVALIYTGVLGNDLHPVLGEIFTAPAPAGAGPSRTAVDLDGNVWVTNRDPSVGAAVKLGMVIGGTRCDMFGRDDPINGEYLKPPFKYNTCIDRDGDGLIRTSRGLGDAFFDDERIIAYVSGLDGAQGSRHVSVDKNNNAWVSGTDVPQPTFYVIDGETGVVLKALTSADPPLVGGYAGFTDCIDDLAVTLWSVRQGEYPDGDTLWCKVSLDPLDPYQIGEVRDVYSPRSYGLGIDLNGNIWNTQYSAPLPGGYIIKFDRFGVPFPGFENQGKLYPSANWDRGVAVTFEDNDVWIANSGGNYPDSADHFVTRLLNDGSSPVQVNLDPEGNGDGVGPRGIAIDTLGRPWVACFNSDPVTGTAKCIDPGPNHNGATVIDTVPLSLPGDPEAHPYAYGGMTGQVTLHTSATGTWNVIHDSGVFTAEWHVVVWNKENCATPHVPADTKLTVEVRAADVQTALTLQPFVEVHSGEWFNGVQGRFLEIRVRFVGLCPPPPPPPTRFTPVLCDLRAHNARGDCNCDGVVDFADIDPFVLALSDPAAYAAQYPNCSILTADCNCDGGVDFADIDPFVACLSAPNGCGCVMP